MSSRTRNVSVVGSLNTKALREWCNLQRAGLFIRQRLAGWDSILIPTACNHVRSFSELRAPRLSFTQGGAGRPAEFCFFISLLWTEQRNSLVKHNSNNRKNTLLKLYSEIWYHHDADIQSQWKQSPLLILVVVHHLEYVWWNVVSYFK